VKRDTLTPELFATPAVQTLPAGALLLERFAAGDGEALLAELERVIAAAPLRHMHTPGGHRMSVAMSNCGPFGWTSDERGYRYAARDPLSDRPWPAMPALFADLAARAAACAGFAGFAADACLINQYEPRARMTLHQDKNERDFTAPIVSVSLGLPAVFLFGGHTRGDKTQRIALQHGDTLVWGADSRLRYHGVLALKDGHHPLLGRRRVNLTFRRAN
jgi:alkylated DNA repair protein (DNA oxidative demethylase)